MEDEGLHEFQLHGKQLVFVVMTATVVAVAIFLCGVMVGRGVPPQRTADGVQAAGVDPSAADPIDAAPSVSPIADASRAASDLDAVEPRYGELLEPPEPVVEETLEQPGRAVSAIAPAPALRAAPTSRDAKESRNATKDAAKDAKNLRQDAAAKEATSAKAARAAAAAPGAAQTAVPAPAAAPRGNGFVVQVSAVKGQNEAETIRRRLEGKGYPAYIEGTGSGRCGSVAR